LFEVGGGKCGSGMRLSLVKVSRQSNRVKYKSVENGNEKRMEWMKKVDAEVVFRNGTAAPS
jgi:hypothetical protein